MKLTVLTENLAGGKFLAEHGLSYLIEHDNQKILFDTGHSDVFLRNAHLLDINIDKEIQTIVLSHGHWDHGDGLHFLKDKKLITHPGAFITRYRKKGDTKTNIGLALGQKSLTKKFRLVTKDKPYKLSENIIFLGEIPRENDFESQTTPFVDGLGNDDFVLDDSGLALIQDEKLIIISGCAHSGICNLTEYARKVTNIKSVKAVIGGFHLKQNNLQTQKTIEYFKKIGVEMVFPSHCTELPALAAFHTHLKTGQMKTGMSLDFEDKIPEN